MEDSMLSEEKLKRISELSKKSKAEGLSLLEQNEQKELRDQYLHSFRSSMKRHIEGLKVVDEEGNDLTPEKLKQIQRDKGIHGRDKE